MDIDIEKKRVLIIEDANTKLKKIVYDGLVLAQTKLYMKSQVVKLIEETKEKLEEIETPVDIVNDTINALKQSFLRWYYKILSTLKKIEKNDVVGLIGKTIKAMESSVELTEDTDALTITDVGMGQVEITNIRDYMTVYEDGGLGRYVDYTSMIKSNLISITDEINSGSLSLVDSIGRKKSLRNMAEIKARYEIINDDLQRIKASGVQYVVSTAHSNASERCSWWQGKIFIIDMDIATREMGQYKGQPKQDIKGYIDGKPYYSLKQACENGFLSYNCQHRLVKYYKGIYIPKYNLVDVEKRRNLTTHQRYLENMIRKAKMNEINALTPQDREEAINISKQYQEQYNAFCKAHNLTNYQWRTRITIEERTFHPLIK